MDEQQVRPPLQRDTEAGMIAGVAAGIARSVGIDVTLVRIAFVLTTVFLGGLGLITYLAAWLLMPAGGGQIDAAGTARRLEQLTRGRGAAFWVGAGLIAVGALALLDTLLAPFSVRLWFGSLRDIFPPLALILIGALLWRSSRRSAPVAPPTVARELGAEVRELGAEVRRDVGAAFRTVGEEVSAIEQQIETYEAQRRAERDAEGVRLGRLTFGLAMLTFGALWIGDSLGLTDLGLGRVSAVALAIIACGLIVGAFVGRPRGLAVAGIVLAPLVLVSILGRGLPVAVDELVIVGREGVSAGSITVSPPTLADVELRDDGYRFGIGQIEVDLTALDLDELRSSDERDLTIELGIGELIVLLPDTVTFDIDAELGIGRLELLGVESSGFGLERRAVASSSDPDAPRVRLIINQGIGRMTIIVRSAS
jgi:phage shock protein PspC (stress-responsive transcriptional regulator)